ncbi:hypothetical protein GQ53DRAFT_800992 [Thozetella sp. PMI_491]|nr:hypothetical protein GQ53DRAFT_800992 [Thozetella sp. PMI_491]
MPPPPPASGYHFTADDSLAPFAQTMKEHLAKNPQYDVVITGAVVFTPRAASQTTQPECQRDRLLLLQRAAHDWRPLTWEIPGGSVDTQDQSVLHGMAREVWEEAGLLVTRVVRLVGAGQTFTFNRDGGPRVIKYTFEVEVDGGAEDVPKVATDPDEHESHIWITEDECREHKIAASGEQRERRLMITTEDQEQIIMEAFRLRRGEAPLLTEVLEFAS